MVKSGNLVGVFLLLLLLAIAMLAKQAMANEITEDAESEALQSLLDADCFKRDGVLECAFHTVDGIVYVSPEPELKPVSGGGDNPWLEV